MADEEFDNVVQGVFGAQEHIIESSGDALHQFYALTQALRDLSVEPVVDMLRLEIDWFHETWDEPSRWYDRVNADLEAADDTELAAQRWADKLADFDKRAGELLIEWLGNVGLGEVRLWVYMPCHNDFARLVLANTDAAAPRIELKVA